MRPWRLSTEKPNLFYAARLMREEEDRQKQKIMHAAGMYIDEDQAPIAGSSSNRDNGGTTGGGSRVAAENGLAGRDQLQPQQQRGEHLFGPPVSPPEGRADIADTATGSQTEVDGAGVDVRHDDEPSGAASTNSNRGGKDKRDIDGGEGEDDRFSGEAQGLDIENDVRKRVLDLVGVDTWYG